MMSLIETSLSDVVKRQVGFKLRAYLGVFSSLMAMQLLAIVFSLLGSANIYYGGSSISVNFSYYSADIVIGFTMLWSFISAILITTKANRYDDFTFVTNRLSSNMSNGLFLLIASVVGGITSLLSGYLIKLIIYYFKDIHAIGSISPKELFIGIIAAFLYVFLCSAVGYLIGIMIQISKAFIILLPSIFAGMLIVGKLEWIEATLNFFRGESSLLLFFIKIIVLSGILFGCAAAVSNRLEVRR